MTGTQSLPDKMRCPWCLADPLYLQYHDQEWGVPVHDDVRLFEFLILEGAQAGLSWLTVLRKRENYRRAFDNFDFWKVACFDEKKINSLLADPGIIRNRIKIGSAIKNARAFMQVVEEFGTFDAYIWNFMVGRPLVNHWRTLKEIPPATPVSDKISKDLKKRGFSFVGSTIVYSHMQATGMVNDHLLDCYRHSEIARLL